MASVRKRIWRDGKTAYVVDWIDRTGRRHNRLRLYREADTFRRDIQRQVDTNPFRPDGTKLIMSEVCAAHLQYRDGRHRRGERMTRNSVEHLGTIVHNHILNHTWHRRGDAGGAHDETRASVHRRHAGRRKINRIGSAREDGPARRHAIRDVAGLDSGESGRPRAAIARRDEEPGRIVPPSKETVAALLEAADPDLRLKI